MIGFRCFLIRRPKDSVKVILLKHKNKNKYSFVNLTKGHICPCLFNSEEEAIKDLDHYKKSGKILEYKDVDFKETIQLNIQTS